MIQKLESFKTGCLFASGYLDASIYQVRMVQSLIEGKLYQNWSTPPKAEEPPDIDDDYEPDY